MPALRLPQGGALLVEGGEAPAGRRRVGGATWGTTLDVEVETQRNWSIYFWSSFLVSSWQVAVCLLFECLTQKLAYDLF